MIVGFVIPDSNDLFRCMSQINENINPWKTIQTEIKYDNPWIQIQHSDVINPSGNQGIYGVVHFKNLAIGIIPLDENNYTWIVGQYRYAINEYSWEIPEGGGKHGVDPIESAKRELLEECGIVAHEWERLIDMTLSNSATDERAIIYVARDLSFTEAEPEDTEELGLKKIHFDELFQMVMDGKITDSMSVAAILKLKLKMLGH